MVCHMRARPPPPPVGPGHGRSRQASRRASGQTDGAMFYQSSLIIMGVSSVFMSGGLMMGVSSVTTAET